MPSSVRTFIPIKATSTLKFWALYSDGGVEKFVQYSETAEGYFDKSIHSKVTLLRAVELGSALEVHPSAVAHLWNTKT